MKTYKVLQVNKTYTFKNLEVAKLYAKNNTLYGGKITVFDGNQKIATYQNGKEI